jgi:glyoxylase-like metal-dependent hydrolase (beta-lactamase superfamily II)
MSTIADTAVPYMMDDEHRFRRSLREIQLFMEGAPDALVIPGHDMDSWRRLDAVYD